MQIEITMTVTADTSSNIVELNDLGLDIDTWQAMAIYDKRGILQNYIDTLPNQPQWVLNNYEEK